MAIQQVVTVYINLKGDGAASTFSFALQNLYQFANGIAVPFGGAGVVPTAVSANNPPVPVTSTVVDANGNITLTTTSPLPASVFTFQLDLSINSGASSSASPTQTTNVTVVGSSAAQILDSGGTNKATVDASGNLATKVQNRTTAISFTATGNTAQVSMEGCNSAAFNITSIGGGGTLVMESSTDGGTTWVGMDFYSEFLESWLTTVSGVGTWWMEPIGAVTHVRVRATNVVSGTITGTLLASSQVMGTFEYQASTGQPAPNNTVAVGGVYSTTQPNLTNGLMSTFQVSPNGTINANIADVFTQSLILQKISQVSTGSVASLQTATGFAANNTIGNTIVVIAGYGSNGTITCSDTAGNVYKVAYAQNNGTTFGVAVFYATNIVNAASNKVTISTTVSSSLAIQAYEVSGTLISQSGIVGDRYGSTGANTTPITGEVVPQGPYSIAFQGIAIGTSAETVSTTGQGWTLDSTQNPTTPAGLFTLVSESALLGSIGTSNNGYTVTAGAPVASTGNSVLSGSNAYAAVTVTFRNAPLAVQGVVSTVDGQRVTYRAGFAGVVLATLNTGIFASLSGSASKLFRVTRVVVTGFQPTSATTVDITAARYSAYTAGTFVVDPATATDLIDPPTTLTQTAATPTGAVGHFTTAPTAATKNPAGNFYATERLYTPVAAAVATPMRIEFKFGDAPGAKGMVLRGTSDFIGISTSALATIDYWIEWTEE